MNDLQIFSNPEFGNIRTHEVDGKVYFVGNDVAKALGYINPRKALGDHCKGVTKRDTLTGGGMQQLNFIPEGDLYRLISHSRLPAAEKFERWIFDEIMPTIRKTGGYAVSGAPNAELLAVISQTVTIAVAESIRQLVPILHGTVQDTAAECDDAWWDEPRPMPRKRRVIGGIICKLDNTLRKEVDEMICSDRYSYREIVEMLAENGIVVSQMSICRYARKFH